MNGDHQPLETPPIIQGEPVSRSRWGIHLVLLAIYPIALGVLPMLMPRSKNATLLPNKSGLLLVMMGFELALFGIVFTLAWAASRASLDQLRLRWREGVKPLWRGFLYSIALRLMIAAAVIMVVLAATLAGGATTKTVEKFRPRTETVVDPGTLAKDPIYFVLMLTLVSFVVAGFREELWRAGMLAGWQALFPPNRPGLAGQVFGVSIAALIFGIGHLPQGLGGAAVTALLGLGLGLIMVRHHSIWEAVFAHGFFNATTFVMLHWIARHHPNLIPGQ